MASVCLYFQVHQPFRLRRYSVFDTDRDYFDDPVNADICRKVSTRCYVPAASLLKEMIQEHRGRLRIAFSITGCALEQFQRYSPETLAIFRDLCATGCVEMLAETYYHSLASLYSPGEFREQVALHQQAIKELFGQEPQVFRNTELVYNNDLARLTSHMGFDGILAEGADHILGMRSPNFLYSPPGLPRTKILLKNYRLSDDIAFRFSNRSWEQWPLTADKFARWVSQVNGSGDVCNLFMDFETFGEHQWAETGIFEFLQHLPREILRQPGNEFLTPSQVIAKHEAQGELDVSDAMSWADTERDCSAWMGNAMQVNAMNELFKLEKPLKAKGDAELLADWRMLTSSDHFYYMCTKYFADGDVHKYFSPYASPYDSYINYMNVLDNIQTRLHR
jgi:alpha-amylase